MFYFEDFNGTKIMKSDMLTEVTAYFTTRGEVSFPESKRIIHPTQTHSDHVEIVDYKTDHSKTADELLRAYAAQLRLYARAIGRRLAPKPVTRCTLYSFALGREVDVPLRGM